MPNPVVYFTGDFMATTPSQPTNYHNPSDPDFGMVVRDAKALGTPDTIYRLEWFQNVGSATTFANGQMWRLQQYVGPANPTPEDLANEANWSGTLKNNLIPKPDLVAGLGLSGDWAVFEHQGPGSNGEHLVLRFNDPFPPGPTTLTIEAPRDANYNLIKTPPSFETQNNDFIEGIVCFVAGTLIATPSGEVPIETLRVGDMVLTGDHGPRPIRWIGSHKLHAGVLQARPNLRPIRIRAGALGLNVPALDLLVWPQHRILVRSRIARRIFGEGEVLVAAKQLLQLDGVEIASDVASVEYFHMLFDQHEVVIANGTETESLYTGPQALKNLPEESLAEVFDLFPELRQLDHAALSARMILPGRLARKLTARHVQHHQPMVMNLR